MPALIAGIHVFLAEPNQRRDGWDTRAFTRVCDALCPAMV
jgi:hypothetical protein